ncbi:TetR/AcrR family transcriptional regulator [Candidatus Gracilibacteria bacterium]|nr:TetR/AcrR family transcriptional regulator [Candidatus Gracilibacteria bacterium]
MPYPAQTSREAIVEMAQTLIERDGMEQLSLAQLAAALNIKAPSLYRHVASKGELLQAVVARIYTQLFTAYDTALQSGAGDPVQQLQHLLHAHRTFAHANPASYVLAFTTQDADAAALEAMALLVQQRIALLSGEARALAALRGALALVHGFVMLELNGQFRRGGDLDAAFTAAVAAYLAGWSAH